MNFMNSMNSCGQKQNGLFFLFILFSGIQIAVSGTTGKIAGNITDAQSGEPLIGANIIIQGTTLGATTDGEGNYYILNLPPGKYTLEGMYVGYFSVLINDVKVSVDQTTKTNMQLPPETLEGETIEVVAQRPIVEMDLTSTIAKITGEEIQALPFEQLDDIVNLQAGVVNGHFRGGRKYEVKYLIDGVAVNDVYSGDYSIQAEVNSIEEVQVLTGTFNAEYGDALSGIVNQITKNPGPSYTGQISGYLGDYVSSRTEVYNNIDQISPSDIADIQGSLSGPVPGAAEHLKFYLSGRYFRDLGYLYGQRTFNPSDSSNFSDNDPANWYVGSTGDGEFVPMGDTKRINLQGKLQVKLGESKWLMFNVLWQDRAFREYTHRYQLNPDGDYKRFQSGLMASTSYTHVFSASTFMDIKASAVLSDFKQYVYEDPLDLRYVDPKRKRDVSGNAFYSGGTENWHFFHETKTYSGRIDLTSQITQIHQLKAGVEFFYHDLSYEDFQIHISPATNNKPVLSEPGSFDYNIYNTNPYQFAAYIQDKVELDYLIVNMGIRFDYFQPDGEVLKNPDNIAVLDELKPPYPDSLFYSASIKYQISPRIGLSYPISEKGAVHLSYGHFFQIPPFEFIYRNTNFRIPLTGEFPQSIGNTIGNADLEPQRTTMYEIGLQQQLAADIGITITVYAKDIRNLLGQRLHLKNEFKKFGMYINRDYGSVRGLTVAFEKRFTNNFSANIDYTYQVAKGNASDPNDEFENSRSNPPIESNKSLVPLDWDRLHSLNFRTTIGKPNNYIISLIGQMGTGLPYTPSLQNQRTGIENSESKPTFAEFDLYMSKFFDIGQYQLSVFVKVYNIFDTANENDVFGDTGRAGYTLELTRSQEAPRGVNTIEEFFTRPDFYSAPRQIILGTSFIF